MSEFNGTNKYKLSMWYRKLTNYKTDHVMYTHSGL